MLERTDQGWSVVRRLPTLWSDLRSVPTLEGGLVSTVIESSSERTLSLLLASTPQQPLWTAWRADCLVDRDTVLPGKHLRSDTYGTWALDISSMGWFGARLGP